MQGCDPLKESVDLNLMNPCIKNFRHNLSDLILLTLFSYLIMPKMMSFLVYSNNKISENDNEMMSFYLWLIPLKLFSFFLQYGVRIFVMTSFKDTCCIEILPHFEKPKGGKIFFILLICSKFFFPIFVSFSLQTFVFLVNYVHITLFLEIFFNLDHNLTFNI